QTLAAIWSELLDIEPVGRNDHFFELGGHSLLAVQLISRLRTRLGREVALGQLFARPVLKEFAAGIADTAASELPAIIAADRSQELPLSFAQQRLWFLAQLEDSASAAYHIAGGVKLTGDLDRPALRRALDRIVARHEALRTSFASQDGRPVQVIAAADTGFALQERDVSGLDAAGVQDLAAAEAGRSFDLATGPLIRGQLLRFSDTQHVLLVTMHHIVSDGWSMGVLIDEFRMLYQAFCRGGADPLPALGIQYADYALWQRRWLEGELLQRQLDYWTGQLSGAPALLELPLDHRRPVEQDYAGAGIDVCLDAELTRALAQLSRRCGATLFMTLLAGWAVLLSRLSGQDDIVIGTPVANRTRAEIEPLIGFFVNTLALRLDLTGAPTAAELLERVKQRTLEAQSHQDIPFEQVVEAVQPARSLSHSPLFQVMFAWQNAPQGKMALEGLDLEPMGASQATAQFDLSLSLQQDGEQIKGVLTYATALFERDSIERILDYWKRLLRQMVADDNRPVDQIELLGAAERRQVLYDWNATEVDFPRDQCIHHLFEAQVEKTPDAVAVVYEDRHLTYAGLNRKANQLAHHLISLGVGPDKRVAIGVERSMDMVVGLLAILKAGGAYVPLDPSYPADRIAYMLEDSTPQVMLTQKALQDRWNNLAGHVPVIAVDDADCAWKQRSRRNPGRGRVGVKPEHLAYVIYTSGSTGKPKGVMVEHGGLVNYINWAK
ncbi:MAG: condensation domain-containing protein, partial [Ignavibacteriaceae bacterium]|nr:condensation domain-containing protein [Ignavibacteriaceae bacterium]